MRLRRGFVLVFEISDGRPICGGTAQTSPHGVYERQRKASGQRDRFGAFIRPRWSALGESLEQGYAETPDVAGRGEPGVLQFWRIVQGGAAAAARGSADRTDSIGGQFQLIIDDQEIRWFQLAMHQLVSVQESQGIESGQQQFTGFDGGEGAPRQDLGEILFGMFHHDEEKSAAFELAAAHVVEPDQMGVGEGDCRSPLHELRRLRVQRIGRHEFDRDVRKICCLVFAEEYRAMI